MARVTTLCVATACLTLFLCGAAAASTTIGVSAAGGSDSSTAYSVYVQQAYEPIFAGEVGELVPTAELGMHYWVMDNDDDVWGGYLAPGLQFTLFTTASFQPFLAGSVGGALLSDDKFDRRNVGSNVLFRTKGTVGVRFGDTLRHRIQGEYTHYSNWGLSSTNDGYDTYGVSYGYSF